MSEKIKNILKIAGIWCIVSFITLFLFNIISDKSINILANIGQSVISLIIIPLAAVTIFAPTILILYLLFKKIKNIKVRIILTAFLIPFTNLSKNYSFYIENNFFYIIDPHLKQKFLPGNLFNSLYKENKSMLSFEKDINEIINIVKSIEEIGL